MHVYIEASDWERMRLQVGRGSCVQTWVGRDAFMCLSWFIHMCVAWLLHKCDMPHSYVWHDSCTCVIWLVDMWDMTHPHVSQDSFKSVPWRFRICDMTRSHAWHDSLICVTARQEWFICVTCFFFWGHCSKIEPCPCAFARMKQMCKRVCPCACACARVRACLRACLRVWSVYATSTFDSSKCASDKNFNDNNMIILFWIPWN